MAKKDVSIINETAPEINNVIDVDLGAIEKRPVRINGDNTKIIYLNLSDLNVVTRLNEVYPKLKELEVKLSSLEESDTSEDIEESISVFSKTLSDVDTKMRDYVDYIFDSSVSDVCVGAGSMYDPFEGKLRYEHIIDALSKLYESNLNNEFKQMQARISKHTSKYHK